MRDQGKQRGRCEDREEGGQRGVRVQRRTQSRDRCRRRRPGDPRQHTCTHANPRLPLTCSMLGLPLASVSHCDGKCTGTRLGRMACLPP